MNKEELLTQLTKLDFIALDMTLFLDTHPNDAKGIDLYNRAVKESSKLRAQYEAHYGPLRGHGAPNPESTPFLWVSEPYPWEEDFCVSL